jgi:hypothetical protein
VDGAGEPAWKGVDNGTLSDHYGEITTWQKRAEEVRLTFVEPTTAAMGSSFFCLVHSPISSRDPVTPNTFLNVFRPSQDAENISVGCDVLK